MKIIKIEFSNINNLKGGPHIINFEESPLKSAGLFAIIGPTGSGKSTILDVITLALFNRIPRFSSAITKNEVSNLGSVLTHHTTSGMASLTYEVKGSRYTSTWNIETARTGKLKDHYMTIHDSVGNIIAEKSEVPSKNEVIIGLKYEQFTKSIILSQGEFSKFLKAGKNERGQLLEDLTGLQIYRNLGKASFQKQKDLKLNLNNQKDRIESIALLTEDNLQEINQAIETLSLSNKNLEVVLEKLNQNVNIKKQINLLAKETTEKTLSLKNVNESINTSKLNYEKLHLHEKISHLKGDVSLYINEKQKIKNAKISVGTFEINLKALLQSINDNLDDITKLTNQDSDIINYQKILSVFEKEILAFDISLLNLNSKGAETRTRINQNSYTSKLKLSSKVSPENALQILQQRNQTLKNLINVSELDTNSDIDAIKEDIRIEKIQLSKLEEFDRESSSLQKLIKDKDEENKRIDHNQLIIKAKEPLESKSEETLVSLKNNEKHLNQIKEDANKIASLSDRRNSLVSGEPCPLCGSKDHPYAIHLPGREVSSVEREIKEVIIQIKNENSFLINVKEELIKAKTNASHGKEFIERNKKLVETSNQKIKNIKSQIDPQYFKDGKNIIDIIAELDDQLHKKALGIDAIQEKKLNETLQREFSELNKILAKFKILQEDRNKIFEGNNISEKCNSLNEKMNALIGLKKELESKIDLTKSNLQKTEVEIQKIKNQLTPKIKSLGFDTIEELATTFLSQEMYDTLKRDYTFKKDKKQALEVQLKDLYDRLVGFKVKDKSPDEDLMTLEVLQKTRTKERDNQNIERGKLLESLKNNDKAKKEKETKEKHLRKLEKEVNRWSELNYIIGDAKGNTFSNFAQGLTLQNLLVLTNIRLQKLTDRYLLDRPIKNGLLTVIDRYQADTVRAVSTLSGGETFLISLALALSLSDMASQNVTIDSLFIDEGFGTLDQETLEVAMDTLEKLQSESQKTVGIISHIEALKERINVQIRLEKNALGYSKIEINE